MAEMLYPRYRKYIADRVQVNDAMIALLAGSRLAAHTLQLTRGSTQPLSQLFPSVEHIRRFNLRSDTARELLSKADSEVAAVAIPYALATHEAFVMDAIKLLREHGVNVLAPKKGIKAWNMHDVLFRGAGFSPVGGWMGCFDVLREARNAIIHANGDAGDRLLHTISQLSEEGREIWGRLHEEEGPEAMVADGKVHVGALTLFAAFAVTKRLGREINQALAEALSTEAWAAIAVRDYQSVTAKNQNSSAWRRSLQGYVRLNYAATTPAPGGRTRVLEVDALEGGARAMGIWTRASWND